MKDLIKVGVLGVGALGYHHARLYNECAGAELVGVYDLNKVRAREVAEKLNTSVFETPEALADEVMGLSIAVPTNYHHRVALDMIAKGKHLLIEKPITETVSQAKEVLAHAKTAGMVVQVGHVERYNPVISYLEEKLDNPRFIESHRLSPYPPPRPGAPPRGTEVSVVLDLMIHDIDMVLNLVQDHARLEDIHIDAVGIPVLSPTEDIANARLRFPNGCVANLTSSRITPEPMRKIRLFQGNSYLSLDYMEKKGEIYQKSGNAIHREEVPVEDHNALLKQLEDFVAGLQRFQETGQLPTPKVSGEHGMRALELAELITQRMREINPIGSL